MSQWHIDLPQEQRPRTSAAQLALQLSGVDVVVRPGVIVLEHAQGRAYARVDVAVPSVNGGGRMAAWCLTWDGGGVWGDRVEDLGRAVVLVLRAA